MKIVELRNAFGLESLVMADRPGSPNRALARFWSK